MRMTEGVSGPPRVREVREEGAQVGGTDGGLEAGATTVPTASLSVATRPPCFPSRASYFFWMSTTSASAFFTRAQSA